MIGGKEEKIGGTRKRSLPPSLLPDSALVLSWVWSNMTLGASIPQASGLWKQSLMIYWNWLSACSPTLPPLKVALEDTLIEASRPAPMCLEGPPSLPSILVLHLAFPFTPSTPYKGMAKRDLSQQSTIPITLSLCGSQSVPWSLWVSLGPELVRLVAPIPNSPVQSDWHWRVLFPLPSDMTRLSFLLRYGGKPLKKWMNFLRTHFISWL